MKHAIALAAVLSSLVLSQAAAGEAIDLLGNASQEPKAWLDAGTPKGFAVEASNKVLQKAGYDVTIKLLPFQRALDEAKRTGIMTGVFKSAEREQVYLFSEPLVVEQVRIAVRKDKPIRIEKAADLLNHKVGSQQSFIYGEEFEKLRPQMKLDEDTDPALRIKKLMAGRIDVAIFNPGVRAIASAAEKAGVPMDQIEVLPASLAMMTDYMILGKDRADAPDLLKRVNAAIAQLKADGTLDEIMTRYGQR